MNLKFHILSALAQMPRGHGLPLTALSIQLRADTGKNTPEGDLLKKINSMVQLSLIEEKVDDVLEITHYLLTEEGRSLMKS